jgi:hypothetical protein
LAVPTLAALENLAALETLAFQAVSQDLVALVLLVAIPTVVALVLQGAIPTVITWVLQAVNLAGILVVVSLETTESAVQALGIIAYK